MDPFLEAPDIWPDVHHALAATIRDQLNHTMPRPYYARMEMRPEVGIVGLENPRRIVPDVAIVRPRRRAPARSDTAVAVLAEPRAAVTTSIHLQLPSEPLRHYFVEIRDAARGHELVTLIEIVSPSNKQRGPDRKAYEGKQRELMDSETSLIEIDLLRAGEPVVGGPFMIESVARLDPPPDYLVGVNRAWQRSPLADYELYPIRLEESLPCIAVPLREGEAEVPLDLQYAFQNAYDGGPYARGAVDYDEPVDPPVDPDRQAWLTACIARWRTGANTPG